MDTDGAYERPINAPKKASKPVQKKEPSVVEPWKPPEPSSQEPTDQDLYRKGVPPTRHWCIRNENGDLLATHVRFDEGEDKKTVIWWRDGKWSLKKDFGISTNDLPFYNCDAIEGYNPKKGVFVVEGEKACDALLAMGFQAVGTLGANHEVNDHYLQLLSKFEYVLLAPDYDNPGREHMESLKHRLKGTRALIMNVPGLPPKGDAADFVQARSHDRALVDIREEWQRIAVAVVQGYSSEGMSAAQNALEKIRSTRDKRARGVVMEIPYAVADLDSWTGGMEHGIYSLAGSPGAGKTTFALQVSTAAMERGFGVAYLTFDLTVDEIYYRKYSTYLGLGMLDVMRGRLSDSHIDGIGQYMAERRGMLDRFVPRFGAKDWTLKWLEEMASASMLSGASRSLIVLDYVQRAADEWGEEEGDLKTKLDSLLYQLDRWSKQHGYPVLLLSTSNRAGYKGAVDMGNFGGSSAVEYVSQVALFLTQHEDPKNVEYALEKYYPEGVSPVWMRVLKSRFGRTGNMALQYNKVIGQMQSDPDRFTYVGKQRKGEPPQSSFSSHPIVIDEGESEMTFPGPVPPDHEQGQMWGSNV